MSSTHPRLSGIFCILIIAGANRESVTDFARTHLHVLTPFENLLFVIDFASRVGLLEYMCLFSIAEYLDVDRLSLCFTGTPCTIQPCAGSM